jgi:hypothetical protein
MEPGPSESAPRTVRELRRRWKPAKDRLAGRRLYEPLLIRMHRAFSWLQRVEELPEEEFLDAGLILRWIALGSLFNRWDAAARQPQSERECLSKFLDRIIDLDADGAVAGVIEEHRALLMSIFDDAYLTPFFWQEPTDNRARKTQKTKFDARTWYVQKQYKKILARVMDRVYFQRCQLVHGGATSGSRLNRQAVRHCSTMLGHFLSAILLVIIDHGQEEDWGPLCYPPTQ